MSQSSHSRKRRSTSPTRRGYSVDEVSRMYRLSRQKIYDEINAGRLQSIKVGTRRIVTEAHLDTWEAAVTIGGAS